MDSGWTMDKGLCDGIGDRRRGFEDDSMPSRDLLLPSVESAPKEGQLMMVKVQGKKKDPAGENNVSRWVLKRVSPIFCISLSILLSS